MMYQTKKQERKFEEAISELSASDGRKVLIWLDKNANIINVGISLGGYGGEIDGNNPQLILESNCDVEGMLSEDNGYEDALYDENYCYLEEQIFQWIEDKKKTDYE